MASNDGGPAYPALVRDPWKEVYHRSGGMSLRDYFAGQAMAALIAFPGKVEGSDGVKRPSMLAPLAYEFADKMLAARTEAAPDA